MKTERTQVQFWSDVFAAVASSGRKVPNREFKIQQRVRQQERPLKSEFAFFQSL